MAKSFIKYGFVGILAALMVGCSANTSTKLSRNKDSSIAQAQKLLLEANNSENEQTAANQKLQAAEIMLNTNKSEYAADILKNQITENLSPNQEAHKNILLARAALGSYEPEDAKRYLNRIWTPLRLSPELVVQFYSTRAEAHRRLGNLVEAARERLFLTKYLNSDEEIKQNNLAIWDTLRQLTPNTLRVLQESDEDSQFAGWIQFAHITKQYDASPEQLQRALALWINKYPNHPATSLVPAHNIVDSIQPTIQSETSQNILTVKEQTFKKPTKIALILPLQGNHTQSAQTIRDGFLAAYYNDKEKNKPEIKIYDTNSEPSMYRLYQTIIADGADFIVGPLVKEEVDAINFVAKKDVPVLALNSTTKRSNDAVFQFGLSPEQEAQHAAEKAWADGHRNALVIIPKSEWGERMQIAFTKKWSSLGGKILAAEEIKSQANMNTQIQNLLAINKSEYRASKIRKNIKNFSFEPRRRADPDMIFLATNPVLARQVKPLLNFYYAGNLPTYSISAAYTGKVQPRADQDLNGIHFCDMPWVLDQDITNRTTYKSVSKIWSKDFEQYSRLFALGLDAYKIAMQIDQLSLLPDVGISGMTGILTLNKDNTIQRKLMWATFKKGSPVLEGHKS